VKVVNNMVYVRAKYMHLAYYITEPYYATLNTVGMNKVVGLVTYFGSITHFESKATTLYIILYLIDHSLIW
jgi:hypothetical protein